MSKDKPEVRYYRKRVDLFLLIDKIRLWPSRTGVLHGIKSVEARGPDRALITTHCNRSFAVGNSRNSRAARWLRNKWYKKVCEQCSVPEWKLAKYDATRFHRRFGSTLEGGT